MNTAPPKNIRPAPAVTSAPAVPSLAAPEDEEPTLVEPWRTRVAPPPRSERRAA